MKNADIARVFQGIADLLELKGENAFKIRVYQKAARVIENLPATRGQGKHNRISYWSHEYHTTLKR